MDPIFVLLINLFILLPCRGKELEVVSNDNNLDKRFSLLDLDSDKFPKNKVRYLKLLPINKEWKNKIDENALQTDKNMDSVPIVLILATAESGEEESSEFETFYQIDIPSSEENAQNTTEEIELLNGDLFDNLNVTKQELETDVEHSNKINDTLNDVREELTVDKLTDDEIDDIKEIGKEKKAVVEDIKSHIENVLSDFKIDSNLALTQIATRRSEPSVSYSQGQFNVNDSNIEPSIERGQRVKSDLSKSYKVLIILNKFVIVK